MNRFDLMKAYVEHALGRPLETCRPVPLTGWQAVEALWPLNERFRPNIHQIRSLPYDAAFEPEADGAIEALVLLGDDWGSVSASAWRVLLERHQQGVLVALANEHAGNPLMSVPAELSPTLHLGFVAAFLLHTMKLPWPVEDRSGLELPQVRQRQRCGGIKRPCVLLWPCA